ncbi:MAG: transporter substrate-binding domain-containing protein [Alphaproteobacteria bacterium]|nr:transporter substrate-binding domain-containing protein [Alphaproteobacteria bacterium]
MKGLLAAFAILAMAAFPWPTGAAPASITVVMDDNYPPYVFKDGGGNLQGILVDVWALWSKKTGIPVTLRGLDWGQALAEFNDGKADAIDTIFRNPAREKIYDFSGPYATIDVPLVFDAHLSGIKDASTVKGFTIGVKTGDACIDVLAEKGIDTVKPYPSYEAMADAAAAAELKVFCIDKPPAIYFLTKKGLERRFLTSPPLYTGQFHWAVRKGQTATFRLIEQGFAQITAAERQEIDKRWLGQGLTSAEDEEWQHQVTVAAVVAVAVGLGLAAWAWSLRRRVRIKTAELRGALDRLAMSEQRFRTIFDNISDAIFIHDADTGAILMANQRMRDMYGVRTVALADIRVNDLSEGNPPYGEAEAMAWIARSADGPQCFEWYARRLDGRLFWVEVSMRRAFIDDGPERLLVVVRDIDERKQAQDQLTRTIDALSRSNTDLERFAYAASHDLREPLNTVVRFAQLLESRYAPQLGEDGADIIGFVVRGAKQMVALVDGLLDYSRVNALVEHFEPVSLDKVLAVVGDNLRAAIADSGARLTIPALPVVTGDEIQLIQLFQNLIGNAIKYRNPEAAPIIALECRAEGLSWHFSLTDNGIGIAPEFRTQVFTIFKRLHTHSAIPGVGMGLAMCKRIVERHGGRIWVDEAASGGTVFHFVLRAELDQPAPRAFA